MSDLLTIARRSLGRRQPDTTTFVTRPATGMTGKDDSQIGGGYAGVGRNDGTGLAKSAESDKRSSVSWVSGQQRGYASSAVSHLTPEAIRLLRFLDAFRIGLRRDGDRLAYDDATGFLHDGLCAECQANEAALLALCDLRAGVARLHERIMRLRYENPRKGNRADAHCWIEREIQRLGDLCDITDGFGVPTGWTDPDDDFTDGEQITVLVNAFNELRQAGNAYPVPLPEGCALLPEADFDPFAHGRRYDWTPL